ncbi:MULTISPECIES: CoA ester lyase [unclassified Sphingomonas]|uniref:HpcH/HpaI aldolase/citrate lyase family protein n=1 Tax=unclassified Sphingomonas TaxID=196159 RepID=UPI00226A6C40|nr:MULTISPECIES: CoA ester lyase [unclassified Sphingomonas]
MPSPLRSALYMPASNARAIAKARSLACDAVILDLEDAVAPEEKARARDQAVAAVRDGGFGHRRLVVRVNGADTPWHAEDLAALASVAPDAVLFPKVADAAGLHAARAALGDRGPEVWAMIETCAAILDLGALACAAAPTGTSALVFGGNDLAKEMRCTPGATRTPLLPALTLTICAARAGNMIALDGVSNAIDDAEALAVECAQGAAMGFDGKTLIHPAQIAAANAAFAPDAATLEWARAVIAAFADPAADGRGAIRLGGAMVERLHLAEAERLVAIAGSSAPVRSLGTGLPFATRPASHDPE